MKPNCYRKKRLVTRLHFAQDGLCYYCGKYVELDRPTLNGRVTQDYPTIDHKLPLGRGGTWTIGNLALSCYQCNHKKADYVLPEIIMEDAGLRYRLFRSGMIRKFLL